MKIIIFLILLISSVGIGSATYQIIYEDDFEHLLFNNRTNLTIPTYDGSGEAIHPDIYYNTSGWNGYKYWMTMTPYPAFNESLENPSIMVSNNSIDWEVPTGLTNPIDLKPAVGYNSDPNFAFKYNTLYCYYREVNGTHNILKMRNSTDGINWSSEYTSLALPNHQLVAPTVIYDSTNDLFYMWYIDSGTAGSSATTTYLLLRNSTDGINWGTSQNCTLSIPNRVMWHANVEYIPEKDEYWLLVSAGTTDAVESNELFFAYSTDKLNWDASHGKVIGIGKADGWDDYHIYQSAIKYINDTVKIWYTGCNNPNWNIGYTETSYADLKTNYKWNYMTDYRTAYFELSTDQVKNGTYSAKYEHMDAGCSSNIMRNVSSDLGGNYTVDIDFYDDGDTSAMKLIRAKNATKTVGLGVYTGTSTTNYIYHSTAFSYTTTSISRTVGWHNLKIKIHTNSTVEFLIDDVSAGVLASQFSDLSFVTLSGYSYNDVFYVDNLVVSTDVIDTSTIIIPANSWGMFNNWTSTMTFAEIAANESNDICYTYYNVTSRLWESYYVGYSWNADYQLSKDASVMGYFNAQTDITSNIITPSSTELYTGWNMLGIQSSSNQTISGIITDIGMNCSDSWYFNSSMIDYLNNTTHSIQPNQGFLAYITQNMTWTRSAM